MPGAETCGAQAPSRDSVLSLHESLLAWVEGHEARSPSESLDDAEFFLSEALVNICLAHVPEDRLISSGAKNLKAALS